MGNHHSDHGNPKGPDKLCHTTSLESKPTKSKVLCNTPYLTTLFKRMAVQSSQLDDTLTEDNVSQTVFEESFNGPLQVLGKLLFAHIKNYDEKRNTIHLNEFLSVSTEVLSLVNASQQLSYYFNVFSEHKDYMTIEDVYHMVQVSLAVALSAAYISYDSPDTQAYDLLRSLASSIMGANEKLQKEEFIKWCSKHIPNLFNGVHSFILIKLSGSSFHDNSWHRRVSQENVPKKSANLIAPLQTGQSTLTYAVLWLLSCSLPTRYLTGPRANGRSSIVPNFLMSKLQQLAENNAWSLLYNSDHDGLSVNRFEHHVFSYKGPSVMLISFENNLYALASDEEWREGSQYRGGEDTMLVQLLPRFSVVDSGKISFLNHHTRGRFKGIIIGSNPKNPVLKIGDMSVVSHYGVELTLQNIEVWGCAGTEIRDLQLRQRAWEHKEVEKVRNRKLKLENWEDNPDRMLLNWAGIQTNHAEKVGNGH